MKSPRFAKILTFITISLFLIVLVVFYINTIASSDDKDNQASSRTDKPKNSNDTTNNNEEKLPSSILDLSNWKLTLPVKSTDSGNPDEIKQPALATYTNTQFFHINNEGTGVVFRANAGGATTSGSSYPRSELREMVDNGRKQASWSNASGEHRLSITEAITALPKVKPEVVAGQIHDAEDDIVMIRLEGKHLFVEADGKNIGTLESNYKLGTVFTVDIVADPNGIKITYNNEPRVSYSKVGQGYYFKAGCYTQSNTSRGDTADAYGEVTIYNLAISHS